jgi:hypothetical protein
MIRQILIGATSAAAIAAGSLVATAPAQAAQVGIYVNPGYAPDDSGCWRWSRHWHHWSWVCQQDYQPEYYQQPYYAPSPFFGFSFGDNGGRRWDHRWDHNPGQGGGNNKWPHNHP